jgi:hyperpolarization activated cyclic nucleotide-gated potassium channel 1
MSIDYELVPLSTPVCTSPSDLRHSSLWKSALNKIRSVVILNKLCMDLRLFGTASNISDRSKEYQRHYEKLLQRRLTKAREDYFIDEEQLPMCMIHPASNFKKYWNLVVTMLLAYTATVMPYRIAFEDASPALSWVIIENLVDGLFCIDILVNCLSATEKNDGSLETSHRQVLVKYAKGWLLFDIVAVMPIDLILEAIGLNNSQDSTEPASYNSLIRLVRLPRLYRLIRISRIFKLVKRSGESDIMERMQDMLSLNRGVMRILGFLMTISICVHIMGCMWFFLAKLDGLGPDTWVVRGGMEDSSHQTQYIAAVYWAVTTVSSVGYGDIVGTTDMERVVSIIWMILGIGFYSFAIGSLSSVLTVLDNRNNELQVKLNAVEQMARVTHMPPDLKRRLRKSLKLQSKKTELSSDSKQLMFDSLPKKLRYLVAMNMYEKAAMRLPFFSGRSPEFIITVIPYLRYYFVEATECIYRRLDDADEIYFIFKGRVNFMAERHNVSFKSMLEGSYFGEIEVLLKLKRMCGARSETDSELLIMPKPMVKYIAEEFPEVIEEMQALALKRKVKTEEAREEMEEAIRRTYLG